MAKKKKKDKKPGLYKGVAQDFKGAVDIANTFGLNTPSSKLDTSLYESYADPNSASYAGKRSEELKDILSKMYGGLAGLDAAENTALREQATKEIQRNSLQEQERINTTLAKNRIRGAAANRLFENVESNKRKAIGDFEQKNLIDNVNIKDQRQKDYYAALTGAETNEFNRGNEARDDLASVNTVNLQQEAGDKASYLSALTGILGYGTAKQGQQQAYNLAKAGMPSGKRPSGSGGQSANPNSGLDAYLASIGNIYQGAYGKPLPAY